eukprot:542542_1
MWQAYLHTEDSKYKHKPKQKATLNDILSKVDVENKHVDNVQKPKENDTVIPEQHDIEHVTYLNSMVCCKSICKYCVVILLICSAVFSALICIGHWRMMINIPLLLFYITLSYVSVVIVICCVYMCVRYGGNMMNTQHQISYMKKPKYLTTFTDMIEKNKIDKQKLMKLLDRYHLEIEHEYRSSVKTINKYKNDITNNIKNEYQSSVKSFNTFTNTVKNNINNIFNDVLSKYKSQIA